MNLQQAAEQYISMGFSVLPINKKKQPLVPSWTAYQAALPRPDELSFANAYGLAVIVGKVSGNVEAIDIDCKYDLTGQMFKEYCEIIMEHAPELPAKLTVVKTLNNGYHFIYRVPEDIKQGNLKLASRPATKEEASAGDKVKVLFETRGEGGYIAAPPTPGYEVKRSGFESLHLISADERDTLFSIARSFDQMPVEHFPQEAEVIKHRSSGDSPFEVYNANADIPALLQSHGWKRVYQRGDRIHFKRPGTTDSAVSANYDMRRRVFYVFTTSSEFGSERGYNPVQVYTILECAGDYSRASRELMQKGFGKSKVAYVERKEQSSELYRWYKKYKESR